MATIPGVLGPIDTDELGFPLMHEHGLIANPSMRQASPDWIDPEAPDVDPMTVDDPRRIFERQGAY